MSTVVAISLVAGLAPSSPGVAIPPLDPPIPPDEPLWFHPVVPARLLDTRPGYETIDDLGKPGLKLGAGRSIDVQITGRGGVPPTGVDSVVVNVTVTQPTAPSFLTIWPAGATRPTASNLNFVPGQTVPNLVVAKLGTAGNISIFNPSGTVDVVVDVSGYFPESDGFVSLVPARLLDTRPGYETIDGLGKPGRPVAARSAIDLQVVNRGGVPAAGVDAVVLNVTGTNPTAATHVTVWPSGQDRPTASNLNLAAGATAPNLVIAKVGAGGNVSLYNEAGTIDLVADVAGYFPTDDTYVPLQPARILETRPGLPVTTGGDLKGTPLGPGQTYELKVLGVGGVPSAGVSAVVLNVTGIRPSSPSFITVSPTGRSRPTASNLNLGPGDVRPNLVVARVGAGGHVSVYNLAGSVHVVVDVAGYFLQEPTAVRDVVTNDFNSCLLDWLGRTTCWGQASFDPWSLYPPVPNTILGAGHVRPYAQSVFDDVTDIAVGSAQMCSLRVDQTVWCWQSSSADAWTGTGRTGAVWPAEQVPAMAAIVDIDAGYGTCALRQDGTVWCWGSMGGGVSASTPRQISGIDDAVAIDAGSWSACALRASGGVACWGLQGSTGVLGDGSGTDAPWNARPVAGLTDADSVDVRGLSACATRMTGEAACWGNSFLGAGSTGRSLTPVPVIDSVTGLPAEDIWQVTGGADFECAVRFDDLVYCLGSSSSGSLGLAPSAVTSTTTLTTPVAGLPLIDFVSAASSHICAVTYESDVWCWGNNREGQVGDGSFNTRPTPTLVYTAFG